MEGAAKSRELLARLHDVRKTKIRDFDVKRLVQEEVLGLQIPVHNEQRVAIFHRRNNLERKRKSEKDCNRRAARARKNSKTRQQRTCRIKRRASRSARRPWATI